MSDLIGAQTELPVGLVGLTIAGAPSTPVAATTAGGLHINLRDSLGVEFGTTTNPVLTAPAPLINGVAVVASLSVAAVAIECKVGATTLANRKQLNIQVQGTGITFGYSSGSQPFTVANGVSITFSYGPNVSIWVKGTALPVTVVIAEVS